ncbi:MAG: S41 family peptidase [Chloroflexaceae bacterium]|nr:S41 family peptidase [Chloroflexaceae bacterium]NJO07121.1 S41 family peptidase [Chloroflexaceae bacterium]
MVRTSHALLVGLITVFLTALIAFVGGWLASQTFGNVPFQYVTSTITGQPTTETAPADVADTFTVFWDVWELVDREFYRTDPLDNQQMTYGAIRGMLQSLNDDYTIFQEPEAAERSRESLEGKFEGIGIYMRIENGEVVVDRPIRGSPAINAGLQSGDIIVMVQGQPVSELIDGLGDPEAMQAVARVVRGPKGSSVDLTIRRPADGTTFDVAIVRDEVPLISVNYQMLEDGVAYVQLTEFKATTTGELDAALRELLPQQPRSMVLDLRNNPGGYLTTAQEVLGRFYDGVALYEELNDGTDKEFSTIRGPRDVRVPDLPLVVLVNNSSASAAEIVAGALRDKRPHTTLLGETSFGKGSVQNIHQLRDGSSVRITIAQWLTPNRQVIHNVGITPDHIVLASQEEAYLVPCIDDGVSPTRTEPCYDAQLSWGLRLLLTGAIPPQPEPTPTGYIRQNPVSMVQ